MKTLHPVARQFRLANKSLPPKVNCGYLFYLTESIRYTPFLHDLTFATHLHVFCPTRHSQAWERGISPVLSRSVRTDAGAHSYGWVIGSTLPCQIFSPGFALCGFYCPTPSHCLGASMEKFNKLRAPRSGCWWCPNHMPFTEPCLHASRAVSVGC